MKCLLIVDVQNDFCPGGALAVPDGDKVVDIINLIIDKFELVISSQDWHPSSGAHFDRWPIHCVANTEGAALHPALSKEKIDIFLLKGTDGSDTGYSAFEATNINLSDLLKYRNIKSLYVTGLATEYCVKATCIDAVKNGLEVFLVKEGTKGIDDENCKKTLEELKKNGVKIISYKDI
ncbi:MAG: isochorismatase family protein [Calditerrivibrio sp.]|nr:isochorismatase family protein [Calditerrivibrio sp.]MCA1933772.1 isochorismatase family protein [Calditerrivibrio sp.]